MSNLFHEKLREIAKLYPTTPAIVWQGETISYEELDKRSDEIAIELSARGIKSGDIVPMELQRGAEWIAYSIGIIKTGAAYAPISSSLPAERLDFILNDIKTKAPSGAITVYYTSGSTGVPKGVILTHSGVMAFCEMHTELFCFHGIRAGVQADVGFDSFLLATLPVLYSGGTLYLMNDAERLSLVGIHRFLMKNKIDTIFLTTQLAVEYMRTFDNAHLKTLLTGGEPLRTFTPRSYQVYNLYGPTECTAYITAHKLKDEYSEDIPIGVPTGKTRVYLVDSALPPSAKTAPASGFFPMRNELCVSGPQLAWGYLGREDETAEKFIPNPFYDSSNDESYYRLMYRTGDLAEWNDSGELIYRGRIDNMVKISGYRIEPGEIEIALAKHPDILAACAAVNYTTGGEAFLSAYCVPHTNDITPDTLKEFLSLSLPAYMIPQKFTLLEKLPLDARTGKVDKSALPVI